MLNLLISIGVGAIVYILFFIWLSPIEAIFPALVAIIVAYILFARRSSRQLLAVMQEVAGDMQNNQIEVALKRLEDARSIGKWQFLINPQIDGHIGMLIYMQRKFKEARPYLEKALVNHWVARGMYGAQLFREKDFASMKKVFEAAVGANKSQGVLWNLYAWCVWKNGETEEAIKILTRANKVIPSDERISANLNHLQNGRRMKMAGYKEQWFQFFLEPAPIQKAQTFQGPMGGMKIKRKQFRQ